MNRFIYVLILALLPITVFSADEEESVGGIEEVIVTAERRASSIQDTAI